MIVLFFISCTTQKTQHNFNNVLLKEKIQHLFLNKVPQKDFILLNSINLTLSSIDDFKYYKHAKIIEDTKKVLNTKNLTYTIYKYAFNIYSLANILLIDSTINKDIVISKLDFSILQAKQCEDLCDSYGWYELAKNDTSFFSPKNYFENIFSSENFELINQKKPEWINEKIFWGLNFDEKKYENKQLNSISKNFYDYKKNIEEFEDNPSNKSSNYEYKIGLTHFLNGEFNKSIETFTKIVNETNDSGIKSFSYYWIGRSLAAENRVEESYKYYLMSGIESPLGLYDSLSGQMMQNLSGKSSTNATSPFLVSWEEEMKKWVSYPFFDKYSSINQSIKSVILMLSQLKIDNNIKRVDEFQDFLLSNNRLAKLYIDDELEWINEYLINNLNKFDKNKNSSLLFGNVAWLNYVVGNYVQSVLLVSKTKDYLDPNSDINNFIYFLFYPKFYHNDVYHAINVCKVDPDIVFAVLRQEGFFTKRTEYKNILDKVCYYKDLLEYYKGDIVKALCAYRVGTEQTDKWLKENMPINDSAIFMEIVPNLKVKIFIQGAIKDYYNFKWIYSSYNIKN